MRIISLALLLALFGLVRGAQAESGRQVIVAAQAEPESYMWTMTKDTFFGGLAGALVGGAVLLVTGFEADPILVAYCAGGGMIAGVGFGVWEIADRRAQLSGPSAMRERATPARLVSWTWRF